MKNTTTSTSAGRMMANKIREQLGNPSTKLERVQAF